MKRLLHVHSLFAAAGALMGLGLATVHAAERPNILWITSEDNGPHLGCYGDTYAITPHLDALAARGMRYTNASSTAPVCAPARTAIISGIYPTSTGANHMRSEAQLPEGFKMYPQFLREAGYYCINNVKTDYNLSTPGGQEAVWDVRSKTGHWKDRPADQPFFCIFNHTISHESQIRNTIDKANQIHDSAKVRIPAYHPDVPEVRKDWTQYYDRMTMMDARAGKNLKELEEAGLSDDTIIFYYGDHGSGMPRGKRWPYRSGLNVPLIVYFPEKWHHLAPKDYEPGGTSDRLVDFVDLAPTLLSLIDREQPAWMQGHAFAGTKQAPEPRYSYGFRSRMDERFDEVRTVMDKRYIYLRHYMPHRIYGQYLAYMFKTPTTRVWQRMYEAGELNEAQSRFWQTKPVEELYDYLADPDEVNNLVDSHHPEHQAALAAMRKAHEQWVLKTRDVALLAEGEMHRRASAAGVTPYELGQNDDLYDLKAISQAAALATSQKPGDLKAIAKLLSSDDSGVRYWGATGLLIHEQAGYKAGRAPLNRVLEDKSPSVAIVAAEALGRFGTPDEQAKAIDVLLTYADQQEQSVYDAILAMNALDYIGDKVKPRLDEVKALPREAGNGPKRVGSYVDRLLETVIENLSD